MNAPSIHCRAEVSPLAHVGPGCRIASGAVIPAGTVLDDGVEIGPNVVFVEAEGNGPSASHARARVRVGANAVVHAGVSLAAGVIVRPGAVVTRSVPAAAIVEGNPATIVGYVNAPRSGTNPRPARVLEPRGPVEATTVAGVTMHRMPVISDMRGNLSAGEFSVREFGHAIPFMPQRYFVVFDVPSRETRGEHAHRACHQFLICVRGSCAVVADDGRQRAEFALDSLDIGLYLPPMTWGIQYRYTADAMLLVFASHHYDPDDYIRDYETFLTAKGLA